MQAADTKKAQEVQHLPNCRFSENENGFGIHLEQATIKEVNNYAHTLVNTYTT